MLGVSRTSAQRALKLLANSNKLLRRRRLGTFIGPHINSALTPKVCTVCVFEPEHSYPRLEEYSGSFFGIVREDTRCTNVNHSVIPKVGGVAYVRHVLESIAATGDILGVLAVSCPREIYKFLGETGLPTVVLGTLYRDSPNLPSADVDNRQAGRLLAGYLAGQGHRRMAVLATAQGRPGDHHFLDGINDALTTAGLPPNAMAVRIMPYEADACHLEVRHLLESEDRPTGLIVRGEYMSNAVHTAITDMRLDVPGQVEVVFECSAVFDWQDRLQYPHVVPKLSRDEIVRLLARLLLDTRESDPDEPNRVVIPVELVGGASGEWQVSSNRAK